MTQIRGFKHALLICVLSLTGAPAAAAEPPALFSNGGTWEITAPTSSLTWELTTDADVRVGLTIPNIVATPSGGQLFFPIDATNAAQYGADWPAWQAAAIDTSYTRSLITFLGVTRDLTIDRELDPALGADLSQLRVIIDDYVWPNIRGQYIARVLVVADSDLVIPEPATWLLVLIGVLVLHARTRRLLDTTACH